MIIDSIKSLTENIKDRIKNPFTERNSTPFGGAFIIALVIYNWELFYSLFNFSNTEVRITRIEIIKTYLHEMDWKCRLGYPVIIAFTSIIFFYVFNNISLGITTFFNRWVKATILYYTDRSKIISRAEFEQTLNKMNFLRTRYEEIKRTFAESQSELETHKNNANQKEGEIVKIKLENEKILKELEESKNKLTAGTTKIDELLLQIQNFKQEIEEANNEGLQLVLEKEKILELKRLIPKEKYAPSAIKQWIYNTNCLVHDYIISREFKISSDTYYTIDGWEIQLFARNVPSANFLIDVLYKSDNFLPKPFNNYQLKNNRLIFKKYKAEEDVETVAMAVRDLLSRLESINS